MKSSSIRMYRSTDAETPCNASDETPKGSNAFVFYVANLTREQFTVARRHIAAFHEFETFDDWDEARRAWQFGLSLAGIEARVVDVDLPFFARGCREGPLNPSQETIRSFLNRKNGAFGD